MMERFIIDDAGTLIDMKTMETYDYVSDVCPVLNELNDENEYCEKRLKDVLRELYCKDRVLEEHNISIECCDNDD